MKKNRFSLAKSGVLVEMLESFFPLSLYNRIPLNLAKEANGEYKNRNCTQDLAQADDMDKLGSKSNLEETIRKARIEKAEGFLQNVLRPAIRRKEKIDCERALTWLEEYKDKHEGSGDDFEVSTVVGRLLDRLRYYPASLLSGDEPLPSSLVEDVEILTILSEPYLEGVEEDAPVVQK